MLGLRGSVVAAAAPARGRGAGAGGGRGGGAAAPARGRASSSSSSSANGRREVPMRPNGDGAGSRSRQADGGGAAVAARAPQGPRPGGDRPRQAGQPGQQGEQQQQRGGAARRDEERDYSDRSDDGAAGGVPTATFVPRDPRVVDGPWSRLDASLVTAAQADARLAAEGTAPLKGPEQGAVLLGQSAEALRQLAASLGHKPYRGQQVWDELLRGARNPQLRGARSVEEMSLVPQALRDQLSALGVRTGRSVVHHSVTSPCGTTKLLLQLEEGRLIEAVGIPTADKDGPGRLTVCVSSQVGCPMRCTFCATGRGGWARNLRPYEILDQVLAVQEAYGRRVTNVVFMGMGEPLLNLPAVAAAYHLLRDCLDLSGRAITISTVGVPNAIRKLAAMRLPVTLAVSIHAPNQQLRERLIPSAKVYSVGALMQDCAAYFKMTKRRVSFEYTLLAGVNDKPEHARELAALLRSYDLASHVNLIPWNPVDESEYTRPSNTAVAAFRKELEAANITTSLRVTRGLEAAAACGQLRNSFQKQALPEPQPLR
ncbi:hypothetical protein Rsub_01205 [Raphidocelis subcapitata]|uniref:Radical SAM core domain-containing protein n=1 Tax=Raphidocelis subcapitata TaxID=307507 RepID=A0A2V0NPL8_9CHLO|nr:hypothetical protein Rsub_01205 [Raphidocelis subcapitata]|eukprot:GBF88492.1 hypothetical protein Rsub_01205 [Raphidocelis subcapitata]